MNEITRLLQAIEQGDERATNDLFPVVYDELRRMAAAKLAHESPGHTLQATALVHEAYLRMLGSPEHGRDGSTDTPTDASRETSQEAATWKTRGHFFAAAAEAMRRILIENARRKGRLKRGGDRDKIELDQADLVVHTAPLDLITLDEALTKLEAQDKTKAEVVKLRFFAGLTIEETAAALGVSEPTVKRYWLYARAWLRREIGTGD